MRSLLVVLVPLVACDTPPQHEGTVYVTEDATVVINGRPATVHINGEVIEPSDTLEGSGVPGSRTEDIESVRGIEVRGSLPVRVMVDGPASARVDCDDNLLDRITFEPFTIDGGGSGLRVQQGNIRPMTDCTVTLHVPELTSVVVPGSSHVVVEGVSGTFAGVLSGSGSIVVSGASQRTELLLSGSGTLDASELTSAWTSASITGSGSIDAHASDEAELTVVGSGTLTLRGPATVQERVTGSGRIRRID